MIPKNGDYWTFKFFQQKTSCPKGREFLEAAEKERDRTKGRVGVGEGWGSCIELYICILSEATT